MYLDTKNVLWIGTDLGLNSLDLNSLDIDNPVFDKHELNKNLSDLPSRFLIRKIGEDSYGNILIGTIEYGLLRLNTQNGFVDRIKNSSQDIIAKNISAIFNDNSGVLWIGTDGKGLFKLNSTATKFSSLHFRNSKDFVEEISVNSVLIDRSATLWIGTDKYGIFKTPLKQTLDQINTLSTYEADRHLSKLTDKKNVTALFEDHSGRIWIGTYGRGVIRYDPFTNSYKSYVDARPNFGGLRSFFINSIYEDVNHDIWIGTGTSGIMKLDKNKDEFISLELSRVDYSAVGKEVHCIIEDKNYNLWFGTTLDGLYFYDRGKNSITQFKHEHKNPGSISANRINSFYKDDQGHLWIATFGGGLNKFNHENNSFTHFNTDNGLPSNIVWAVLQDDQRHFWLSTDKGLCRFDPENLTAKIMIKVMELHQMSSQYGQLLKIPDPISLFLAAEMA
jgi:ligand-binding sensor domain-containing protein